MNVEIITETCVPILPVGRLPGMMKMLRHPDGTIYLNTQCADLSRGLARSTDDGRTWTVQPLSFPDCEPAQHAAGFGIGRDGRLWIVHQFDGANQAQESAGAVACPPLYVSCSEDGGSTWDTRSIDFGPCAPTGADDPYIIANAAHCYPNFVELPDNSLAFSCSMRYIEWAEWEHADQTRPGVRDVMIRSCDGGRTWGDPTIVHQHATETDFAADPADPHRILAMTRKQRGLLPGEERESVERETGCRPGEHYVYKGGLLLESVDSGRTFREVPDSYTGWYGHRGAICWTPENVVIVAHHTGYTHDKVPPVARFCARISPDGGRTWIDGSPDGTRGMNRSRRFTEIIGPATVAVGPDRFFTAYSIMAEPAGDRSVGSCEGFFWHLERS